ncbi:PDDEXK family nuclease [Streptomyces swartbergensis]|uniref:hypothetical protein n=1 Tax=Streptomyces swartbergensis TaxID=487165 RepID=UPI00380441E9
MTEPMDAVPTTYVGTRFRSRLEADWAVTLDGLGILWEYEPELIVLPSGTHYVPDFWLPDRLRQIGSAVLLGCRSGAWRRGWRGNRGTATACAG